MSWIKFILMIPVGLLIVAYTVAFYLFCFVVSMLIIATSVVVLLSWKIPNFAGIRESSPLFMPFFFIDVSVIILTVVFFLIKIIG